MHISTTFKPTFQVYELTNLRLRSDQHYAVTKWRGYEMTIIQQYILPSHKEKQAHHRKCSEKKYKASARIKGFAM